MITGVHGVTQAEVATAIHLAGASFDKGELAYLALTSKIERPFMDRVSYQLHKQVQDSDILVGREYSNSIWPNLRADIAILKCEKPIVIVEAKACATFDWVGKKGERQEYPKLLQADIDRYSRLGEDCPQIYSLLLGTHLLHEPSEKPKCVIKYHTMFARAFRPQMGCAAMRKRAEQNLLRQLIPPASKGTVLAGGAFGVDVEILWWLWGPFRSPDNLHIQKHLPMPDAPTPC